MQNKYLHVIYEYLETKLAGPNLEGPELREAFKQLPELDRLVQLGENTESVAKGGVFKISINNLDKTKPNIVIDKEELDYPDYYEDDSWGDSWSEE